MEIFDKLDGILATLEVPFYNFMPEFAREPPDLFVTYNVYDTPALRGDGGEIATRFFCTFDLFGKSITSVDNLYFALCEALQNNGFCRSGASYTSADDFPKFFRITVEFTIDL